MSDSERVLAGGGTATEEFGDAERILRERIIGIFVRAARMLDQPRSIGEIYGLLYLAPEPLSMDRVVEELGISAGSASQGLRQLRGFGAVRRVYITGARKDFFAAEVEFRKLAAGFLDEKVSSGLEEVGRELEMLRPEIEALPRGAHMRARAERLIRWQGLASKLLRRLLRFVRI